MYSKYLNFNSFSDKINVYVNFYFLIEIVLKFTKFKYTYEQEHVRKFIYAA